MLQLIFFCPVGAEYRICAGLGFRAEKMCRRRARDRFFAKDNF